MSGDVAGKNNSGENTTIFKMRLKFLPAPTRLWSNLQWITNPGSISFLEHGRYNELSAVFFEEEQRMATPNHKPQEDL